MSNTTVPDDPQIRERFREIHPPLAPQAALVEAHRCLYCFDAPCTAACPTHIDVPGFIKRIATGNLRGSALRILDANVLGGSCARACPVDILCEGACVMHRYNRDPIQIAPAAAPCHRFFSRFWRRSVNDSAARAAICAWPASALVRHRWRARRSCGGTARR